VVFFEHESCLEIKGALLKDYFLTENPPTLPFGKGRIKLSSPLSERRARGRMCSLSYF